MPEDGAAVLDAVETPQVDTSAEEPIQSTGDEQPKVKEQTEQEKLDNRKQPDALKKHIADLRRRADAITDPVEKKAELDRIKFLYDTSGKARGYEEQFPTVREAREVRALLEAVGGREGVQQMQATLSEIEQIDQKLSAGDPSVVDKMWDEAPEGMPKLMPALLDKFAATKPQEFEKFIAPRSVGYLDKAGFPQAFDLMVKAYEGGKLEDAKAIRDQLIQWVVGNRQQAQETKQADPEVERLRAELAKRDQGAEAQKVETSYNAVVDHAGPIIDAALKNVKGFAKLGLTADQQKLLKQDVWDHLQRTRNADSTYKTVAPAKQKLGYDKWADYAKRWTVDNAEASARAMVQARYGHQLQNGAQQTVTAVTKAPGAPQIQTGKQPEPSEIDYSVKGKIAAQKAGFKDVADMLLSGQAPLKVGGIRKWR